MNLADIYRASDVQRWQIVKTAKQQSVAEHSFGVAMIADRLASTILAGTGHRGICVMWAMWHDLPEVYTGDIATPLKLHIKSQCESDPLATFEGELCGPEYRHWHRMATETHPEVAAVVKLADIIESCKFLAQNAMTDHGRDVRAKLTCAVVEKIGAFKKLWPDYNWDVAGDILREVVSGPERHMDDILE